MYRIDEVARLLAGPSTPASQVRVLTLLRADLAPILAAERVPGRFDLVPGTRLRERFGYCRHFRDGRPPVVAVRCTTRQDGVTHWRSRSALLLTLLHEAAHLKFQHHAEPFWSLHRRLLDRAALAGLYSPSGIESTTHERARGDEKLAGSAAHVVATAARQARRERFAQNQRALRQWSPGMAARVTATRGPLRDALVCVEATARTRVLVRTPAGRRYYVPASLLVPLG